MRLLAVAVYDTPWFRAVLYVLIAMALARIADALLKRRDRLQSKLTGRDADPADRTRYVMIRRLIVAAILFFGVAMALWQFQVVSALGKTLLASAAIFGAVIGIAARAPLANRVSCIMIAFSQPVRLNDYISVDDVYGTVERISLTYTFIRTPDDDRVVIPNEAFANRVVHNYTMGAPGSILTVAFTVPAPTKEATLTTSGSRCTISATARWRATICLNEMDCAESVTPTIRPVSCSGRRPLGTMT